MALDGVELIRRRPRMYLGSTDEGGLRQLVWEVVDNAVDEALSGACNRILVTLHADGSLSVADNGRGIPVDLDPRFNRPAVEVVLTTLRSGVNTLRGRRVAGGRHGVGLAVVNALSERLQVRVHRGGAEHVQAYRRGVPVDAVAEVGPSGRHGTTIRIWPDRDVFQDPRLDREALRRRLRELAFLNQGLSLVLVNEATGRRETYSADDGIVSFVRHLNRGAAPLDPIPFFVQRSIGWTHIEIALQFTHGSAKRVLAFANHVHMDEGGSHLDGFRAALARVLDSHARDSGMTGATAPVLTAEDVGEGLTAVISVMLLHPRFEGPDRTRLGNAEVEDQVAAVLSEALGPYLDRRPADTRTIVERSLAAARRREADRGH